MVELIGLSEEGPKRVALECLKLAMNANEGVSNHKLNTVCLFVCLFFDIHHLHFTRHIMYNALDLGYLQGILSAILNNKNNIKNSRGLQLQL